MKDQILFYIDEMTGPLRIPVPANEARQLIVRIDQRDKMSPSAPAERQLSIILEPGSSLELFILSGLPASVQNRVQTSILLKEQSSLKLTELILDEGEGTYHTEAVLEGAEAVLDYAGAYGSRNSTNRLHTLQTHHFGKQSKSRTTLKSALKDSSHLVFKGLIHVDNRAAGTDAYLSNRNMVLNDGCRAESLPQLQIETDDVACSHGSTTGGPREEELFYIMSRGLSPEEAKELLVMGHLSSILNRFPPSLAEEAEEAVSALLLTNNAASTAATTKTVQGAVR
ncbi:SufD family Fe-S cluster assembly protein [Gracilinema caldarium]|uniref:SufB/SufD family protein n=1 Tax=Gracilinema caldarium TaxID=215591 RepID=UPI0026EB63EB|nr:SufD family Fe-S cluster assembly protein [Gracilinema caldarium]